METFSMATDVTGERLKTMSIDSIFVSVPLQRNMNKYSCKN